MPAALSRQPRKRHFGLTLLELVIVLAILAVLTTVAVQSMAKVAEKARYEATQKTIQNIRSAILGDANGPSDSFNSFVADTGRLPMRLAELVTPLDTMGQPLYVPFAQRLAADSGPNSDVTLAFGWHGPYLQLLFDTSAPGVFDGWG